MSLDDGRRQCNSAFSYFVLYNTLKILSPLLISFLVSLILFLVLKVHLVESKRHSTP